MKQLLFALLPVGILSVAASNWPQFRGPNASGVAYDFSGKEIWHHPFSPPPSMYGAATSPILAGGQLILQRDGDSTNSQLVALAPATGRTLWESPRPLSGSCSSTPMVLHHDGLDELIVQGKRFLRDGAMWTPIDPATGRRLIDRERLGIGGQFSASPIAANGFIYAVNTSGTFAVFRSSDTLEIVAVNALAENVRCTPAIAGNRIYVRSTQHLWAFGQ